MTEGTLAANYVILSAQLNLAGIYILNLKTKKNRLQYLAVKIHDRHSDWLKLAAYSHRSGARPNPG